MKKTLEDIVDFRDKRDWKQFHKPKDLALAIGIEVSELQELFLWKNEKEEKELKIPTDMVDGCPDPSDVTNIPVNDTDTRIKAFCGICDSIPASVNAICGSPEDGKECVLNGKTLKGKPIATQWTD